MKNKHLIYYFVQQDGTPFYVGMTDNFNRRKGNHRHSIKNGDELPKYRKARKLISEGFDLNQIMIIAESGLTMEQAKQREIDLIKELKEKGIKLYNLTSGGEGFDGWTKEQLLELSKNKIGKKHSLETRKRISEARLGMKFSDEHKENLSRARKKRIIKEETCIKMSKTSKGKINIKRYKLIDPEGNEYFTTEGLVKFCEDHNLTSTNLSKVLSGERKHHKGWTIERVEDE